MENYFLSCRAASTDNSQKADLAVVLQSLMEFTSSVMGLNQEGARQLWPE
jgi:hypothetical protein